MQFSAFAVSLDDEIRGHIRPAMWLLTGAVACLLLIACANVAGLLLVRADARTREVAVRMAIGAAPDRLVRQLLTESLGLAVAGGALGLAFAAAGLRVLTALDPTSLPALAPVTLDGTVVAFTLVLALATTLVFGLAPATRARRINLASSLGEGGQQSTTGRGRRRAREALVVAEIAVAVVLVVAAGLMVRSLSALGRVNLGFEPAQVLTMRLALPQSRYDTPGKVVDAARLVLERLRGLPGVEAAGVVRALPLATTIGDFGRGRGWLRGIARPQREGRLADRVTTEPSKRCDSGSSAAGGSPRPTPPGRSPSRSSTKRWPGSTGRERTRSAAACASGRPCRDPG